MAVSGVVRTGHARKASQHSPPFRPHQVSEFPISDMTGNRPADRQEDDMTQVPHLNPEAARQGRPELERKRFMADLADDSPFGAWVRMWRQMLLVQDGSATLLCETLAQGPITLEVLHQTVTSDVPAQVKTYLPGTQFIERQVCMSHKGSVMMDNLSYVALAGLAPDVRQHLEQGRSPIGYIFGSKQTRKRPVPCADSVLSRLWARCGVPDPDSARSYVLEIENASCMLITETYRAGMMRGLPLM